MFKNISKKRLTILLVSLLSVVAISVGVTLAYVLTNTKPVENQFKPSKVACAVVENGGSPVTGAVTETGDTKDKVQIQNTGDTDAYIRVAVVVTWKKADGTVWAQAPVAGTDYTAWTPGTGWVRGADGYYYYTNSVAPDALTGILINKVEPLKAAPETGYTLSVEIVASAIQAKPTTVVTDQWKTGVSSVNGTTLVIKEAAQS
jgi:hypothetical protein